MENINKKRFNQFTVVIFVFFLLITLSIQGSGLMQISQDIETTHKGIEKQIVLSMDFEDEWLKPQDSIFPVPSDWVIDGITQGHQENNEKLTHYWSRVDKDFSYTHTNWESSPISQPYVNNGDCAAIIWGNDGYQETGLPPDRSDEWLITPPIDFSSYYNITLKFWSIYVPDQWIAMPFPKFIGVDNDYLIKTSVDDGKSWQKIADLRNYMYGVNCGSDVYNHYDQPIVLELKYLSGVDNGLIAWHYQYDGSGISDLWAIDDIVIEAIKDEISPQIEIIRPKEDNIYILDAKVIPMLGKTIIIGPFDVVVDPTDQGTGTSYVEFYKNDQLVFTDFDFPYSWNWNQISFGRSTIRAVAYDCAGNFNDESITLYKLF